MVDLQWGWTVPMRCAHLILRKSLLTSKFLMQPVFAANALDAAVAYSCTTDRASELKRTLQAVQACTPDHYRYCSCIFPRPLLLHGFFPYPEPPDIFLHRVRHDHLHRGSPRELQSGIRIDKVSSTLMKSRELSTESLWTPTFT